MAYASVEINKKRCIKCDGTKSSGGLFTCDGCQQMFCLRHVNEHRQELNFQLENTMQEHDLIQQESSRVTVDQSILEKIDAWEKESIAKIQKVAETTRADLRQCYQSANDLIKKECDDLANNLRSARDTEDYSESDLSKWNKMLDKLRRYLESVTKVDITENRQFYITYIKVQHNDVWLRDTHSQKDTDVPIRKSVNRTTNRTESGRSENIDSQPSTLFRRPKQKEPINNNNECKQQ